MYISELQGCRLLASVQTRAAAAAVVAVAAAAGKVRIDPSGPELYPSRLAFSLPSTRWPKFGLVCTDSYFS